MVLVLDKNPRSPGTHIVSSWVMGRISLFRDPRTGTRNISPKGFNKGPYILICFRGF